MKRSVISTAIFALAAILVAACSSNSALPNIAATPASQSHDGVSPISPALNFDNYGDPCKGGTGTVCGGGDDWSPPLPGDGGGGGGYNPGCPQMVPIRGGRHTLCISGGGGITKPTPAPTPNRSCIKTGTGGSTSYAAPRKTGGTTTANAIVSGSAPLQNLAVDVANVGSSPTISLTGGAEPAQGALPAGTYRPASYTPSSNTIDWNDGLVDYGVDYLNQSAAQIMFHEFDHGFYDFTAGTTTQLSPTMSATIGGTTYTWTIYTVGANGAITVNQSGFDGYQHMMIHDDLVSAYGTDTTGALKEALQTANNAPADAAATANANSSQHAQFPAGTATQKGRPQSPVTTGVQTCNATTALRPALSTGYNLIPFIGTQS